jgi:2-desacetyl-2-hydroxyethyl bacteriochlorophyllide A dehydrogenase
MSVPASIVHKVPGKLDNQLAALIEPVAVACNAVRRARLRDGENTIVIGAGPIGLLVAQVARSKGARVRFVEVSSYRREFAGKLGFEVLPVAREQMIAEAMKLTANKGADVVFEVSGSQGGAEIMTALASVRGRIGLVGVHAERRSIDLHRFFWREIELIGVRVYRPEDYEEAIRLVSTGALDLKPLITDVRPVDQINDAFAGLVKDPKAMKVLLFLGRDT